MTEFVSDSQLPADDGAGSEVISSEANYSSSNATEISIDGVGVEKIHPITSIQGNNVYQFEIKSAKKKVLDVKKTKLRLLFQICKADGTDCGLPAAGAAIAPTSCVLPINGLGSAIFTSCEIRINDIAIESGDTMYNFKADIQNRLCHSKEVQQNQMGLYMYENEPVKWDSLTGQEKQDIFNATEPQPANPKLNPFIKRWLRTKGSKKFIVETDIYADFFKEVKFLPPNTSLGVALTKMDNDKVNDFCLLSNNNHGFQLKLLKLECVFQTKLMDQDFVDVSIRNMMNGAPYRTSYPTCSLLRYATPAGQTDLSEYNIFKLNSYSPERFFMVLIDQDAFNGTRGKDPFCYKRQGVKYFVLHRGDGNTRHLPVHMDRWQGDIEEGLSNLYTALNINSDAEESVGIDYWNFDKGNFFIGFDLSKNEDPNVFSLPDKSTNSVEITAAPLGGPIAKLVYAEFNTELLIDAYGNPTVRKNALA